VNSQGDQRRRRSSPDRRVALRQHVLAFRIRISEFRGNLDPSHTWSIRRTFSASANTR